MGRGRQKNVENVQIWGERGGGTPKADIDDETLPFFFFAQMSTGVPHDWPSLIAAGMLRGEIQLRTWHFLLSL